MAAAGWQEDQQEEWQTELNSVQMRMMQALDLSRQIRDQIQGYGVEDLREEARFVG